LKSRCAYCGKEIELNKGQLLAMQRGMHVYCSEECRLRFKALERGVSEETILEKIEEAGGEISQSELLKQFGIRDNTGRIAVTNLISFLEKSGIISKIKKDERTVILKLVEGVIEEEEVDSVVSDESENVEVSVEDAESDEFGVIEEVIESVDVKRRIRTQEEKIATLEKRVEILEKKVQILRNVIEKLARALAGD